MALGVSGKLRPRIFSTFGATRVVVRQPNAPAAFTPGEIPGTHFHSTSSTWFCRKEPRKKSQVTSTGIDPETVRLVAQRLSHYATPGPVTDRYQMNIKTDISEIFPPGATQPIVGVYFTALYWALASLRTRLLDHTQRRATVGRTPLNE